MFTVNGKELEYDVFDADKMEAYEDAMQMVASRLEAMKRQEKQLSASQFIRRQCQAVSECFDALFGPGTSQEIFNGQVNLRHTLQAFGELVEGIRCQQAELQDMAACLPVGKGTQAAEWTAQAE